MLLAALPRSILIRQARHPLTWTFAAVALVAVPLMSRWSPTRSFDHEGLARTLMEAWMPLAGLVGACAATHRLQGLRTFLPWTPPAERWKTELIAVTASAALAQLPFALGALIASPWAPNPGFFLGLLLCDLHLAALATLILRLRSPAPLPVLLLAASTWLPSFVPSPVAVFFDVGGHLHAFSAFPGNPAAAAASLAPVAALLLLVSLPRPAPQA